MQPQQPYSPPPAAPTPSGPGQYDFIMQDGQSPRYRQPLNSRKQLLFIIGGALVVILLIWAILAMVLGGGGSSNQPYITLAQEQAEMVRISAAAKDESLSGSAKNFVQNSLAVLQTDQTELVGVLAKNGTKLGAKQLALKKSNTTDDALAAAKSSGTYQSTYISTMQQQLQTYQTDVQKTYQAAASATDKALLKKYYDNSTLLLEQSKQI